MTTADRRKGLEQEFFLVDEAGVLSDRSDEFLQRCQEAADAEGLNPESFNSEWVKGMIEINTSPVYTLPALANEYLHNLKLALQVGPSLGLKLYPLSSYPLAITPVAREELWYEVQIQTVGRNRFLHAGRCTGTHLHLDLPDSTVDPRVGVSYNVSAEARVELLNTYNLATALDPALTALARACPFYEGQASGLAVHTAHYRGRDAFGWDGVYTELQAVGGLQPYAASVEELVEQQFSRYYTWLEAMDRAGVARQHFQAAGGNLLKAAWNPVRLNKLSTVEMRGIDSNYPEVILAIATLIYNAATRVRHQGLTVRPELGVRRFELSDTQLLVPDFEYLNGDLLYAAATEGTRSPEVMTYLKSILKFATRESDEGLEYLGKLSDLERYQTTEAELQAFVPSNAQLSEAEGLRLVRESCDKLEKQVATLFSQLS